MKREKKRTHPKSIQAYRDKKKKKRDGWKNPNKQHVVDGDQTACAREDGCGKQNSGQPVAESTSTPDVECRGVARPFFAQQRACNKKRFEYKTAAREARAANLVARRERRKRFGGRTCDPVSANPLSFRDTPLCDVMHYFDTRLRLWDESAAGVDAAGLQEHTKSRHGVLEAWGLFCCKNTALMAQLSNAGGGHATATNLHSPQTNCNTDTAEYTPGRAGGSRSVMTSYFSPQPTGHEIHRRLIRQCRREVWGEVVTEPSSSIDEDAQSLDMRFVDGTCRSCRDPGMTRTRFEWVCGKCGDTTAYADAKDRHFKETDQCNPPSTGYERKNHLNEWLARIQASERKMIPSEVTKRVAAKFLRWGVSPTQATYRTVRQFLKDDGLQRYFEHIPQIICYLTQTRPTPIREDTILRIRGIFKELQGPFDRHKPRGRKNFLSYSFVLYKIFELLDLDEYLPYFPMLKSRGNLIKADILWRRLCGECNYEFIPTV
jgi:hypothetical protein